MPGGRVTDALTDVSDIFPTLVELSGASLPADREIDGTSLAPIILGKTESGARQWTMALGFGPAKCVDREIQGREPFTPRVLRDNRFKVWVNAERQIEKTL